MTAEVPANHTVGRDNVATVATPWYVVTAVETGRYGGIFVRVDVFYLHSCFGSVTNATVNATLVETLADAYATYPVEGRLVRVIGHSPPIDVQNGKVHADMHVCGTAVILIIPGHRIVFAVTSGYRGREVGATRTTGTTGGEARAEGATGAPRGSRTGTP